MRIVAGDLKSRVFDSPHRHRTHPMSDKIRGALFNVLGDITDLHILDAFTGSGGIAFEAISRGAASVLAIDSDRSAQKAVADNIDSLGLQGKVKLIKASASAWLSTSNERFDVVILDPPYDNLQPKLLVRLAERTEKNGVVVLSLPPKNQIELPEHFQLLANKSYGDAMLLFYREISV